ncbi:MAG: TerB family tellurite resistance protein [Burkholderiaceae bacterium]
MLDAVLAFFERRIAPGARHDDDHALALAGCALLFEMVRIDADDQPVEREVARRVAVTHLGLAEGDIDEILVLAERQAAHATDYYQFTR